MLEITPALHLFSHDDVLKAPLTQRKEAAQRSPKSANPTILVMDDQEMVADTAALVM